jgi:hypothetical protein
MADAIIASVVPTSYGQASSLIAELLVSAGWTYKASGDGLAGYSSTGKIFTGTGSGALGWGNARAWARLQDPSARREVVLQFNAPSARVKYSALAKFTGGSPSATVTPSATDEKYIVGGASDATPTYGSFFSANILTSGIKYQGFASGTSPYGFWVTCFNTPAGATQMAIVMDPVQSVPEDPDPVVWHYGISNAFSVGAFGHPSGVIAAASFAANGGSQAGSWGYVDAAMTNFAYVMPHYYCCGVLTVGGLGGASNFGSCNAGFAVNPFNAKHEALPILWARPTVATGVIGLKGWSKSMRWTTVGRTTGLDTLDNKRWVCHATVWLPWDGLTTPSN